MNREFSTFVLGTLRANKDRYYGTDKDLLVKSGLNNFLLPPKISIVFVQECSVVFRRGGSREAFIFAHQLESLGTNLSNTSKIEVGRFSFM